LHNPNCQLWPDDSGEKEIVMGQTILEKRVAALEHKVVELTSFVENLDQPKDWRSTIGAFSGDEIMKKIDENARKFREADRRKAKAKYARSQRAKA
jgi:hypothetical protein